MSYTPNCPPPPPPPMSHRVHIPRRYVPHDATNIRETFERERERLRAAAARRTHADIGAAALVAVITSGAM